MSSEPAAKRARLADVEVPEKSPNDKLEYRLLTFPNGFEALLVACDDQQKSKSAAAVSVAAGSFSDPQGRCEGLAHYLEHMLFMGSSKYPGEDEMEAFLSKHGGYSNAFTESSHTCYYLEVNKTELHTALDMLAQFFIAPLLKSDSAMRELNAIDAEFRLTQNSDDSRGEALFAHFAKPGHPFRTFGWGNLASLKEAPKLAGIDINDELRSFYSAHYRAPRLRLCVFGVEALDGLQEAVLRSFSELPADPERRPQEELLEAAGLPFEESTLPKLLRVRPVKDVHKLCLGWQLPPVQHLYLSKPGHYLEHLVGHEGTGSLLSWLKHRGLATDITVGIGDDDFESNSMCSIFNVDITLTALGLSHWPEVVHATFLYLAMLRKVGPQRWVHEEIVICQDMGWRFLEEAEPEDYVQSLACKMRPELKIVRAHLLKADFMTPEWDPEAITGLLSNMTPSRCMIHLLSSAYGRAKGAEKSADGKEGAAEEGEEEEVKEQDEEVSVCGLELSDGTSAADPLFDASKVAPATEPHFGTEFWESSPADLSSLVARWESLKPQGLAAEAADWLRLPDRNQFLATNFDLAPAPAAPPSNELLTWLKDEGVADKLQSVHGESVTLPSLLPHCPTLSQATCRLWHLQDSVFKTPRSEIWLKLSSSSGPLAADLAASSAVQVRLDLLARLITDALNETAYLAEQANLHLNVSAQGYGLDVKLGGFHHKLPLLLEVALCELQTWGSTESWAQRCKDEFFSRRFSAQREELLRGYRNAYMRPGDQCADLRRSLVMAHHQLATDKSVALEALDIHGLASFAKELVPNFDVELLVQGNFTVSEARELGKHIVFGRAATKEHPPHPPMRIFKVPTGQPTVWIQDCPDAGNRNAAMEMYWQIGTPGLDEAKQRAELDLLEHLLSEPLFDALRTKEQIGYVASCSARCSHRVVGFSIWLVSSKVKPSQMCQKVLSFLGQFRQRMVEMSEEDFTSNLRSLALQKMEPERTLHGIQSAAWAELQERSDIFHRPLREAVALSLRVCREDVLRLVDGMISEVDRRLIVVASIGGCAKFCEAGARGELETFRKEHSGCRLVTSRDEFLSQTGCYESFV